MSRWSLAPSWLASDPAVGSGGVVAATELRMVRMLAFVRAGTAGFVYVPLISWNRLALPWLALAVAIAASLHSAWFVWWSRRVKTPSDPVLVWSDVAVAVVFMLVGSRAAPDLARNLLMTPLVPYSLVTSAVLGFSARRSMAPVLAVAGLMATWVISLYPDYGQKLGSDLLGFVMWYLVAFLIGREMLNLARQADIATARAERSQKMLAERAIHNKLLPIIERVAQGGELGENVSKAARKAAILGRAFLGDRRHGPPPTFEATLKDAVEGVAALGLTVRTRFLLAADPPPEIAEVFATAVGEALNNARRHAGPAVLVEVQADSGPDWLDITVIDDGYGFDPEQVAPGLGFTGVYAEVRALGGECFITASPGEGTSVTLHWEPRPVRDIGGIGGIGDGAAGAAGADT
ncbi:Signal transduction histidine kinase [Sinosporangium album]|uniref:Signal transduction histidine kinase n=1 Tax=Sinosporangium album TaxID=504805 RepID=A0A1G7SEQ0_9ACTN|nr:ATP-binding protein [Sinosporangium album]SDG20680.1 Signal transduction histidine kinase [Sinosporangium album]